MLVHTHQKMDAIAPQPSVPGDGVSPDLFEGVAQVRIAMA